MKKKLLTSVCDAVQESLGYPAGLIRLLEENQNIQVKLETPAPCIAASSIVHWHELGTAPAMHRPRRDRGFLMGWRQSSSRSYQSFQLTRPEYSQIGLCEIAREWKCDVTEVHGFSSSKSELRDFTTTDEMVETNSPEMIDSINQEKLAKNLAHKEIRIIHSSNTSDHFARYQWDGRLFLMNDGGSHHLAAAKYIATRLSARVPLQGALYSYALNAAAIAGLRRDYEMFVISDTPEISSAFHDAMRTFEATWLWHDLPHPYEESKAILLPKNETRSMRVAVALRHAGITDFGAYLTSLAARQ